MESADPSTSAGSAADAAPALEARRRESIGWAAFWSATWAVGVTLGVALGGWLTLVGGSGAPGAASLDVTHDVIALPLIAGAVVFAVLFIGRLLVSFLRRRAV